MEELRRMRRAQPSALLDEGVVLFQVELDGGGVGVKTGSNRALSSGNGMVASGLGW
jgi:hypothetical protein